jgi:hypothetical protein
VSLQHSASWGLVGSRCGKVTTHLRRVIRQGSAKDRRRLAISVAQVSAAIDAGGWRGLLRAVPFVGPKRMLRRASRTLSIALGSLHARCQVCASADGLEIG